MKKAFTLAEVLITLGIIGIVAAMTIPTLITNYQKNITITRLKEVYSTFANVLLLAKAEHGDTQYWENAIGQSITNKETATTKFCEKYIIPYLSGAKIHGYKKLAEAGIDNYVAMNGQAIANGNLTSNTTDGYYIIELKNGQIIFINYGHDGNLIMQLVSVYTDINGRINGPNAIGRDTFLFKYDLKKGRFIPYGYDERTHDYLKQHCTKDAEWSSLECAALIMKDGWEINYW